MHSEARRTIQTSTRPKSDNETNEVFVPKTDWARNEEHETLLLFLPGFQKEKLRVQLTDHGVLKISGTRVQDDGKLIGFRKDVPVPSSCDAGGVTAKFEKGVLFLRLPKKPTPPSPQPQQEPKSSPAEVRPDTLPPAATQGQGDNAPPNPDVVSEDAAPAAARGGDGEGLPEREERSYGDDDAGSRKSAEEEGEDKGDGVDGAEECRGLGGGSAVEGRSVVGDKKYRRKCIEMLVVAVCGLLLGLLLKRSIGSTSHHELQQL